MYHVAVPRSDPWVVLETPNLGLFTSDIRPALNQCILNYSLGKGTDTYTNANVSHLNWTSCQLDNQTIFQQKHNSNKFRLIKIDEQTNDFTYRVQDLPGYPGSFLSAPSLSKLSSTVVIVVGGI